MHETTFLNHAEEPARTPPLSIALGAAEPVSTDAGIDLNLGVYDGEDANFVAAGQFVPGFFARNFRGDRQIKSVISLQQPAHWASVKNQFFTAVLTPEQPGVGVSARRLQLPRMEGESVPRIAITGSMQLALNAVVLNGENSAGGFGITPEIAAKVKSALNSAIESFGAK